MKRPYLTREDSLTALKNMKNFHDECYHLFKKHGFDLLDNLGRRNILLSQAQEKYFAEVISQNFSDVKNDGKTGEPDIFVGELNRELECKLTTRTKAGSISFQTDYSTLAGKKSLDYLYVVASENFDKFAVVHYSNLTVEDFRAPSSGSRGKSQMKKYHSADRSNVLVGDMISVNLKEINKIQNKMKNLRPNQKAKSAKLLKSLNYWETTPTKYTFRLEEIDV
tara:strand:- start:1698 stop:2366 length:669 start_codon:yes stop_codon:yes gene_type:complete